jgi:hypothetical protein
MSVGGGDVDLPRPSGMPEEADDYEAAVRRQEQREDEEPSSSDPPAADEYGQRPQQGYNEPLDPDDQPGEFGGPQTITPRESPDKSNT